MLRLMPQKLTAAELTALDAFRQDCCTPERREALAKDASGDEQDWFSLSIGYFVAKGLAPAQAHRLALHARYKLQYWS